MQFFTNFSSWPSLKVQLHPAPLHADLLCQSVSPLVLYQCFLVFTIEVLFNKKNGTRLETKASIVMSFRILQLLLFVLNSNIFYNTIVN